MSDDSGAAVPIWQELERLKQRQQAEKARLVQQQRQQLSSLSTSFDTSRSGWAGRMLGV